MTLKNPYYGTLNLTKNKVITLLKQFLLKQKLIKKKDKFNHKIVKINDLLIELCFINKNRLIIMADYDDFHKNSESSYINKVLNNNHCKKIIVVWYLSIVPIVFNIYDKNLSLTPFPNYTITTKYLSSYPNYKIDHNWISASKTRNYSLDDPLIDYLEYNMIYEPDDLTKNKKRKYGEISGNRSTVASTSENPTTFLSTIFSNGNEFEKKIVDKLKTDYPNDFITIIDTSVFDNSTHQKIRDPSYFYKTVNTINSKKGIIYQGVFHDIELKCYGLPDLIVIGSILNQLCNNKLNLNPNLHYIVDIKSSNLHLASKSDNILNSSNVKPFKTQIAIYHNILSKIQKNDTKTAFILSSGWTRKQKNISYSSSNPFDRLGTIDFENYDKNYMTDALEAIEWNQLIRNPESSSNLNCLEPNNINLYPNMSNNNDDNFKKIKRYLANKNDEITNIWMCGPKNRALAITNGITKWSDLRLNSKIMNINGRTGEIIDLMLKFNRNELGDSLIYPTTIKSVYNEWYNGDKLAFYIDFETVNCSIFESKDIVYDLNRDRDRENDMIFMIGIGHSVMNQWVYKCLIVESLSDDHQKDLIHQMLNYIKEIQDRYNDHTDVNLYHWSNFEPCVLNKLCNKYDIEKPSYRWTDILKLFQSEPILIKGALNFSLKTVGRMMYEHKLIDIYWSESNCKNGLDAMYQAYQIYAKQKNREGPIHDNQQMKIIEDYNLIDCKIMWAILNRLRQITKS